MKEKTFLDRFMASVIFASPVVYIALVIMEIAGIPAVSALGGMVFFGGLMVGSALVGAAAAMIRVSVKPGRLHLMPEHLQAGGLGFSTYDPPSAHIFRHTVDTCR